MPVRGVRHHSRRLKARAQTKRLPGQMNGLEKRYADHLNVLLATGVIDRWDYEPVTLKLAHRTRYTPDFRVILADGSEEFHETKGFMRDDAHVKIKVAAASHPYVFRLVQWRDKAWQVTLIPSESREDDEAVSG